MTHVMSVTSQEEVWVVIRISNKMSELDQVTSVGTHLSCETLSETNQPRPTNLSFQTEKYCL